MDSGIDSYRRFLKGDNSALEEIVYMYKDGLIRDVITIKIDYTDGTAETLIFDITVNDEGYIFVTQRGVPNTAA